MGLLVLTAELHIFTWSSDFTNANLASLVHYMMLSCSDHVQHFNQETQGNNQSQVAEATEPKRTRQESKYQQPSTFNVSPVERRQPQQSVWYQYHQCHASHPTPVLWMINSS